jgi:hypothetical protein
MAISVVWRWRVCVDRHGVPVPIGVATHWFRCHEGVPMWSQFTGGHVLVGDMHNRLTLAPHDRAAQPLGMPPVCLGYVFPQIAQVVWANRTARYAEHSTAGMSHSEHAGIERWVKRRAANVT